MIISRSLFSASSPEDAHPDQVAIVAYSGEGLAANALLQMIATVTNAKARAIIDMGLPSSGRYR